jgi:AhpD family alkylhydroperoxidase
MAVQLAFEAGDHAVKTSVATPPRTPAAASRAAPDGAELHEQLVGFAVGRRKLGCRSREQLAERVGVHEVVEAVTSAGRHGSTGRRKRHRASRCNPEPDRRVKATGSRPTKGTEMEPRMNHPAMVVPGAMDALQALGTAAAKTGVPFATRKMVELRASQINGCSVCVDMHTRELRKAGESEERIATVAAWREAPWFNDAERAALDLTEAVTRLADRSESVTDEIWQAAAEHYDEAALGGLLLEIGSINVWNRLNAATRQLAGAYQA